MEVQSTFRLDLRELVVLELQGLEPNLQAESKTSNKEERQRVKAQLLKSELLHVNTINTNLSYWRMFHGFPTQNLILKAKFIV